MAAKKSQSRTSAVRRAKKPRTAAEPTTPTTSGSPARLVGFPVFGQPSPTPDPATFLVKHPSDNPLYNEITKLNAGHKLKPVPFPDSRGFPEVLEPTLTLQTALGDNTSPAQTQFARNVIAAIQRSGQIVFHAGGDCGSVKSPRTQELVVDKMLGDFNEAAPSQAPSFHYLLGDIVYSFGETKYYYDQFYEPYRDYPAPIFAVAGNHDGMLAPDTHEASLSAFLRNFCSDSFVALPEAGGLSRTAQVQPGVFFTLEAPFVRIVGLYSNNLEDPGYISDPGIGDSQLRFLEAALIRVSKEKYRGALIFATHHPTYAGGGQHAGSPGMQAQIDAICERTGVWPHAVLAGHAHSQQRFTRIRKDGTQIPYVICGNTGHNVQRLRRSGPPTRVPQVLQAATSTSDEVVFESYDDQNYGYLRIIASAAQLRIEYHPASDGRGAKTPDDAVTVDLASRTIVHYQAPNLGFPAAAKAARAKRGKRVPPS